MLRGHGQRIRSRKDRAESTHSCFQRDSRYPITATAATKHTSGLKAASSISLAMAASRISMAKHSSVCRPKSRMRYDVAVSRACSICAIVARSIGTCIRCPRKREGSREAHPHREAARSSGVRISRMAFEISPRLFCRRPVRCGISIRPMTASGQTRSFGNVCLMSGLPPKADSSRTSRHPNTAIIAAIRRMGVTEYLNRDYRVSPL